MYNYKPLRGKKKTGENLHDLGISKEFLDMTLKPLSMNDKNNKSDFIKR